MPNHNPYPPETTFSREELLGLARQLSARCGPSPGRQAAVALAVLRSRGLMGLRDVLGAGVEVRLGANSRHWQRFREVCARDIFRVSEQGGPAVAFLLTWIARLARGDQRGRPPRR